MLPVFIDAKKNQFSFQYTVKLPFVSADRTVSSRLFVFAAGGEMFNLLAGVVLQNGCVVHNLAA